MKLKSEHKINARRDVVFAALNNPEILRRCIPGCDSLDRQSETEMSATVTLKIGPVKARFKGQVELSNLVPPESYSISGKGSGGAAGFAKGAADIRLVEDGTGTILEYEIIADVGGRIAQLGGRLIESTARSLAAKFFSRFCELVERDDDAAAPAGDDAAAESAPGGAMAWLWVGGGIAIVVAISAAIILYFP